MQSSIEKTFTYKEQVSLFSVIYWHQKNNFDELDEQRVNKGCSFYESPCLCSFLIKTAHNSFSVFHIFEFWTNSSLLFSIIEKEKSAVEMLPLNLETKIMPSNFNLNPILTWWPARLFVHKLDSSLVSWPSLLQSWS